MSVPQGVSAVLFHSFFFQWKATECSSEVEGTANRNAGLDQRGIHQLEHLFQMQIKINVKRET